MFEHDYKQYPELTNTELSVLQFSSPHVQITEDFKADVVKVHDGDTVTLRTTFRDFDFPLRLLDIDSKEMNEGGDVARDWLKERILNQAVEIRIDKDQRVGKYGRLLGKIYIGGLDLGQEEIYLGLAHPFGTKKEGKLPDQNQMFAIDQWL